MSTEVSVDMATALELPLGTENEAKFVALRNLHLKKIKQLMASLDLKDKEMAKLKVTTKDNRRTQMIQALRNKIRDLELINDVMKEELSIKAELSRDQVNDFVMKKTLGGPKRFRPLTREEMENKIFDLEKKLARKAHAVVTSADSDAKRDEPDQTSQAKAAGRSAGTDPATSSSSRRDDAKGGGPAPAAVTSLVDLAGLLEEVQRLRSELRARDTVADRQRDEISRLRSRNSELVVAEEELSFFQQQISTLQDHNDTLTKAVEDLTSQLAECTESASKVRSESALVAEHDRVEVLRLEDECAKLLKQNGALVQSLTETEDALARHEADRMQLKERGDVAATSAASKDARIKTLEEKLVKAEERTKQLEAKTVVLEAEAAQVPTLKNQLRDKNIQIKEMQRNAQERDRVLQLRAGASELPDGAAGAGLGSSGVRAEHKEEAKARDEK